MRPFKNKRLEVKLVPDSNVEEVVTTGTDVEDTVKNVVLMQHVTREVVAGVVTVAVVYFSLDTLRQVIIKSTRAR